MGPKRGIVLIGHIRRGASLPRRQNNLPQPSFPSVFSSSLVSVNKGEETDPLRFGFRSGEVIELAAPRHTRTTWPNNAHRDLTGNSPPVALPV